MLLWMYKITKFTNIVAKDEKSNIYVPDTLYRPETWPLKMKTKTDLSSLKDKCERKVY